MNGQTKKLILVVLLAAAWASSPLAELPVPGDSGYFEMDSVLITLERTACFGACPIYRVSIAGSGNVVYKGLEYVKAIGIHEKRIPVRDVVSLLNEFLRVRFFDALDRYENLQSLRLQGGDKLQLLESGVDDVPSTILTLQIGPHKKTVVLYDNYPLELKELADTVDRVSGALEWAQEPR